jgi:hypothetical protein
MNQPSRSLISVWKNEKMKMKMKMKILTLFLFFPSLIAQAMAQTPPAIPGVPEPGLVLWGVVVNAASGVPVNLTSASWTVGQSTPVKSATYDGTTKPPVRIVSQGGQTYYVVEVPFDTRVMGSVTLADPSLNTVSESERLNSFELKATSPPTYTLTPTMNGVPASVRAIDSAPASGNNFSPPAFTSAGSTGRGRVIRVDLAITPPADPYDAWASSYFGSTSGNGARTADPDGDGATNEQEYLAGTLPNSNASILRILTIGRSNANGQVTLGWQSVTGKTYQIETATALNGPWTLYTTPVLSQGSTSTTTLPATLADPTRFFRVKAVSP